MRHRIVSRMSSPSTTATSAGVTRLVLLALAIAVATTLAYLTSLPGEFIWDDDMHVTHNPVLRSLAGLRDIWIPRFTPLYEPNTPQYYPLAFTALWIQFQAFGVDPLGYHLVNLGFHVANALLVWAVFARLRMKGAWLLGALFALHPMHVETTAWAMEIKNLLSGFFYLAAAYVYLGFDARWNAAHASGGRFPARPYALALALFVGALLAKSITCTLPAALVLALLFRRERIDARRLAPLLPFLVVGIALALNTAWLEHNHVGAQGEEFVYSPAERALIASRVLLFYPLKLLAPWPLLFVYPRWEIAPSDPLAWWPVLAVIALALAALVAYRRGLRGPPLALAYFAGSILPASGIVTYYPMLFSFVADHFNYLPSLGILALVAAAVRSLAGERLRLLAGAAILAALGILTAFQSAHYATAEALYRHTLAHNPDAWLARTQLAQLLLPGGQPWKEETPGPPDPQRIAEAEELLRGALERKEDHAMPHYNLALALFHQQRHAEALPHALRAGELMPLDPEIASFAGMLAFLTGDRELAAARTERALELDPAHFRALMLHGDLALARGDAASARAAFARALDAAPNATALGVAAQKFAQGLQRSSPAEALAILEQLGARRAGLPAQLDAIRAQALAALGRRAEAIALTEQLALAVERSGPPELAAGLRAQLEDLRRAADEKR